MNKVIVGLATAFLLLASFSANADTCKSDVEKKAAIKSFIEKNWGKSSIATYPRGNGQFGLRFYPNSEDLNCMGEVQVNDQCLVQDVGQDVLSNNGLEKRNITCWVPENEQG